MNTLIWQLRQWARTLGTSGLVGLAAAVLALLVWIAAVLPLQMTAQTRHVQLEALEHDLGTQERPPAPPLNPLANLPPTGDASQLIGELEQLAEAHGLSLPRGQYSVAPADAAGLNRWRLVLPLQTDYPTLHAFLASALERLPNLTLDELRIKRERIESTELQVELRMSLFIEALP